MWLRVIFVLILFVSGFNSAYAKEPSWFTKLKQIRIFQSTKMDIERIFDNPTVSQNFVDGGIEVLNYEMPEGKLKIALSSGNCERPYDYRVGKGTVINVRFSAEKLSKISNFNFNKTDFETREDDAYWLYYFNKESGVEYETYRGKVGAVQLLPSLKNENLKCNNQTK